MLSEHELISEVRQLYPQVKEIEARCLDLFNKFLIPGRGPTGVAGTNELMFTIHYLRSSANLLERLGIEKGLILKEE